jgi:hypothetical protein
VVVTVVLALAALDARLGVERPVWDVTVPAAWAKGYAWVAETPPDTAILELPYGQFGDDVRYMVYALSHRRALANGYSGTLPRFPDVFGRFPEDVAVQALEDAGVRYVLVHPSRLGDNPFGVARLAKLAQRQELLVASFDDTLVYAVPPTARPPEPPLGRPLPRDGWRFVPPVPGLERALDGDPATHWEASSATGPVTVRVDLGHETRLSAVVLALERHVLEYPRQYAVRGSLDGRTWRQLGAEGPTVPPFASYRRDHRDVRLRLRIEPATVRFLELTVGTYPRDAWWYTNGRWGIHELLVYESPPDG